MVNAGPGVFANGALVATVLRTGDRVLLPAFGGSVVTVDGVELEVFREAEILGKLVDIEDQ